MIGQCTRDLGPRVNNIPDEWPDELSCTAGMMIEIISYRPIAGMMVETISNRINISEKGSNVPLDWRLKSASPFEGARGSNGMGTARTTTCVQKETASM